MKISDYQAQIQWDNAPKESLLRTAVVTLPDGTKHNIEKRTTGTTVRTPGGAFSAASSTYWLGGKQYFNFDDLCVNGLKLTPRDPQRLPFPARHAY